MAITKREESLPLNGSYYTLGEEIRYCITYTNTGELPMLDVEIFDLLNVAATAEHAALMQWMMAREASLIALYPNNPEVVAQAMVKTIMDRVNDLCQVSR